MAGHPAPVTQLVLAYRGANRQVIVICATAARIHGANDNDTLRAKFLLEAKDHSPDSGIIMILSSLRWRVPRVEQEARDEPLA